MRTPPETRFAWILWIAALSILSLGASPSAEVVLVDAHPDLRERLAADSLVILEKAGTGSESFITAYIVFEQPLDVVIDLLRETDRQREYRTELAGVRTIADLPDGRIDEHEIRILFTTLAYRLRYVEFLEDSRFEWELDPSFDNDVARLAGFWELSAFAEDPKRTLGRFGSSLDVGPAVPQFVQERLSRRTVFRYLQNCREWVDSHGEWRP